MPYLTTDQWDNVQSVPAMEPLALELLNKMVARGPLLLVTLVLVSNGPSVASKWFLPLEVAVSGSGRWNTCHSGLLNTGY